MKIALLMWQAFSKQQWLFLKMLIICCKYLGKVRGFLGESMIDNHSASIERARQLATEEGLTEDRIRFEVSSAVDYRKEGYGYDLITFFDCLHDMGDPISDCA